MSTLMTSQIPLFPETILMSSGGIHVLSHIGVLKYLDSKKRLKNVKRWAGVSGGALIATCIVLGYTLKEIQDVCERFDFQVLQHMDEEVPFRFMEMLCLNSGENVTKFIHALFRVHGWSAEVTFSGLRDAGRPDLIVWSADMDAGQLKKFSFETTPDESVAFALQASMQIPIMYPPLVHKETGHILVDGALIDSMPIWDLGDDIVKNTLALLCRSPPQNPSPRDVIGYVKHLIMTSMDSHKVKILNSQYKDRIINITLPRQFLEINFNLSVDEKRELLDYGYTIAEQWSGSINIQPKRRYSI